MPDLSVKAEMYPLSLGVISNVRGKPKSYLSRQAEINYL
ncbi:hypothetical protein THF5G08_60161 [Vibrio jasicida]|nr:hypothetical protein THF5G08_60161 [Vibrio jasicida]